MRLSADTDLPLWNSASLLVLLFDKAEGKVSLSEVVSLQYFHQCRLLKENLPLWGQRSLPWRSWGLDAAGGAGYQATRCWVIDEGLFILFLLMDRKWPPTTFDLTDLLSMLCSKLSTCHTHTHSYTYFPSLSPTHTHSQSVMRQRSQQLSSALFHLLLFPHPAGFAHASLNMGRGWISVVSAWHWEVSKRMRI